MCVSVSCWFASSFVFWVVSQDDVKAHLNLTLPREFRSFPFWRGKARMSLVAKTGSFYMTRGHVSPRPRQGLGPAGSVGRRSAARGEEEEVRAIDERREGGN